MRLIDLHKEWMEKGGFFNLGLCNALPTQKYKNTLQKFVPSKDEQEQLRYSGYCDIYWGSGLFNNDWKRFSYYTPLRQTIVLLICAMNNEL